MTVFFEKGPDGQVVRNHWFEVRQENYNGVLGKPHVDMVWAPGVHPDAKSGEEYRVKMDRYPSEWRETRNTEKRKDWVGILGNTGLYDRLIAESEIK